ncbi:hypothetical protein HK102_005321 [Quaeritorhiza haematococci]|nr:hypothetical protein HK102_005321 [Quaeritorhiza haematococci]
MGWGRRWSRYADEESRPGSSSGDSEPPIDEGAECQPEDSESPVAKSAELFADAPKTLGEFTFGGPASTLPPVPGLFVDGVGRVPVPLVPNGVTNALIAACEQAPFGTLTETRGDVNVRRTFQISPNKVRFENTAWEGGLKALKGHIAARLGLENMPFELLIYEPGGGDLVVYHHGPQGEQETVHDFGGAAGPFGAHYAVHYADAEHAVTPITDGYPLALVYSICWPENAQEISVGVDRQLSANISKQMEVLVEDEGETAFHYFLEHEYTPKSISELGIAAEPLDLVLSATSIFYGSGSSYRYAEYETDDDKGSVSISGWFTVEGAQVSNAPDHSYDLDNAECILNPDGKTLPGLWRGHRSNTYEGYLGNAGPTKDTTYFKWVLVALPMSEEDRKKLPLARLSVEEALVKSRDYSTAFTSKLLELILSKSFAESVPTLFEAVANILIWDIVPQLVRFLRSPFWELTCEPLLNRLHDAGSRFQLGMYLVHLAHQNQVAPDVWAKLLSVALSALPPTIGEQQQPQITDLLRAPMWEYARGPLVDALAADRNAFAVRLQFFSMAVNAQVTTDAAISILPNVLQAIPNDLGSQQISNMVLLMFAPYWQHAQKPLLSALSTTPARFKVRLALIQSARNREIPDETWHPLFTIALSGFPTAFKADHIKFILILMQPMLWPLAHDRPPLKHVLDLIEKAIALGIPADIWQQLVPLAVSSIPQPISQKSLLVSLMNPKLWPSARQNIINALSQLPVQSSSYSASTSPRFEISLGLVDKARAAAIPVEEWQQLLPIVISGINAYTIQTVTFSTHQLGFGGAIFSASDNSIIDLAVNAYHSCATPVQLEPVLNCILSLQDKCTPHHRSRLVPLLQKRMDWLRDRINMIQHSGSNWCMPDTNFPEYPELVSFLHGPQESIVVSGRFNGIAHARSFAQKYSNREALKYGSLSITASGVGRRACVTIRKTRAYFEALWNQTGVYTQEYRRLDRLCPAVPNWQLGPAPAQTTANLVVQQVGVPVASMVHPHPATNMGQNTLKRPRSPNGAGSGHLPRPGPAPGQQGPASASGAPQQPRCEVIYID